MELHFYNCVCVLCVIEQDVSFKDLAGNLRGPLASTGGGNSGGEMKWDRKTLSANKLKLKYSKN